MESGKSYYAGNVVSGAGAKTTIKNILPEKYLETEWAKEILSIPSSSAYICLNLGFKGDIREGGATR